MNSLSINKQIKPSKVIGVTMDEKEIKDKIIQLLKQQGKMFIKDIAGKLNISPATVSKYLGILHAEGKVSKSEQRPYKYWQIKDK